MIKRLWPAIFFPAIVMIVYSDSQIVNERLTFEQMFLSFGQQVPVAEKAGTKKEKSPDQPDIAAFHDFLMTFDPATGTVPRERLRIANEQARKLKDSGLRSMVWYSHEADMGGRTRTIMYDPNDPTSKKVWAGGVTGGLWYNTNITNAASPWVPVSDFWSNLAIRCLAYDPQNPQTFYVGTGEAETAMQTYRESSGLGFGIGRSDDGGETWYHIPGTEQFAYVTDIVVRIENGLSVLYAGVASGLYMGSQHQSQPGDGLFRSADHGSTWQQVLPLIPGTSVSYCVSDIALGADNRLYVGTRPNLEGAGAAIILWSDNGTDWNVNQQYQAEILTTPGRNIPGRVVLGTSPADSMVVYALIASGYINPENGFRYFNCYHILRSGDKGETWVKKALPTNLMYSENFATIAWHALALGVDPNNADWLYIGGLDLHKSFNGGNNWLNISNWTGMYSGGGTDYVHADQHAIIFKPGSSNELLFGSDGGVFYTNQGTYAVPVFEEHNKGFNTLQVYTCALHPQAGFNQFYGGLQDNGSLYQVGLGEPLTIQNMVTGGDGAYCFIDKSDPDIAITSIYYNQYIVFDEGNYINSLSQWSSGTFVSPADLDYRNQILYCNAVDYIGTHEDQLLRIHNPTFGATGNFFSLHTGSQVPFTVVRSSPHSPAGSTTLFVGSASGRLFRVAGANTPDPAVQEIGSSAFPAASLSAIAVGSSEDTLVVTFSNYGVPSVWVTADGGENWTNAEGNLPDMPVRWVVLHPQNDRQAMIATESGVWECTDLFHPMVVWFPVNAGMGNVRTDMLDVRTSDHTVLAATHGRGFFTLTWDVATGVNQVKTELLAGPNPTDGIYRFRLPSGETTPVAVTVTTLDGRAILHQMVQSDGSGRYQIDLSGQPDGVCLVSLTRGSQVVCAEKIVIRK